MEERFMVYNGAMRRFFSILFLIVIFTALYPADTSDMVLVHESPVLRLYAEDVQDYSDLYGLIEEKTGEFEMLFDKEVSQLKDMKDVVVHEMVHLYFPSSFIFIREGMAEYFSGRIFPIAKGDIPRRFTDMVFYIKGPEETRKAYNASGWMMKYIFEECLPGGLTENRDEFAAYAGYPDDYGPLGFSSEQDFFDAFASYLENQL